MTDILTRDMYEGLVQLLREGDWDAGTEWGHLLAHDAALRAALAAAERERDALAPLARLGLGGLDGGSYYLDALVRVGVSKPNGKETGATTLARAVLARLAERAP